MIGSRLADALDADFDIVRVDRERADLLDLGALERAFAGCQAIVHLAAGVLRNGSWDEVWDANLLGLRHVFEAARHCGCRRVIYTSSLHVMGMYEEEARPRIYAADDTTTLSTELPMRPANPYAVTKACGEIIARYYSDVHDLDVAIVRIGTMTSSDSPHVLDAAASTRLRDMSPHERQARLAAKWFSHADLARLVRAILASNVRFAVVYGVGANPGSFVDLEAGRRIFGFWPRDGAGPP